MKSTTILFRLFLFLFFFGQYTAKATHILGGDLTYTCIDTANHVYDVNITLFRDCLNGQAPYDAVITLFAFRSSDGTIAQTINISKPPTSPQISAPDSLACPFLISAICIETITYTTQITLPPLQGGYDLGWSRCCYSASVDNYINPLGEGISLTAHVPDPGTTPNSSPAFDYIPPPLACLNLPVSYSYSATDVDGDSLVYSIVEPYGSLNSQGLGTGNPMMGGNQPIVDPLNNLMGPPPYIPIQFAPPYGFSDPSHSGNFSIDPATGMVSDIPAQLGRFNYTIQVAEYRDGVLLSEIRRDFPLNIVQCNINLDSMISTVDYTGLNMLNDTILINEQDTICLNAEIDYVGFTLPSQILPTVIGPGEISYTVSGSNPVNMEICWAPICGEYNGETIPFYINVDGNTNCLGDTLFLDTLYIKILDSPGWVGGQPPTADFSYTQIGDTTISFTNNTAYGQSYLWYFGDGYSSSSENPVHQYPQSGTYYVTMIATNKCGIDTLTDTITISSLFNDPLIDPTLFRVFPNPSDGNITLLLENPNIGEGRLTIYSLLGVEVKRLTIRQIRTNLDLHTLPAGIYYFQLETERKRAYKRVQIR